jgi:EmrB/QacA subfamily drug resistance transporter
MQSSSRGVRWTFLITSLAAFMTTLDVLVVNTALPAMREHMHAGLADLEWIVNAYTLTFAVFLLPAAALAERFGRRRVFVVGLGVFSLASAAAALAPTASTLIAARALQGAGGAAVLPLSLTLLSAAVPSSRRGAALGFQSAIGGFAVAVGPLVGGALTQAVSWQFIFWINVPIGLIVTPLAAARLDESHGYPRRLDPYGLILVSTGLFAVVFGLVNSDRHGWTTPSQLLTFGAAGVLLSGFLIWQRRAPEPMVPLTLFRSRGFTAVNASALLFSTGLFGAFFLLTQYLQAGLGYGPLGAGLRLLPWTVAPVIVAPLAGPLCDRIGGRPLICAGLTLEAVGLVWIELVIGPHTGFACLVAPFVLCGIGTSLFFVPVANVVLGSVSRSLEGVASGVNNAIRELGCVLGVALLAAVFATRGSFATVRTLVDGLRPALLISATALGMGAVAALGIPAHQRSTGRTKGEPMTPLYPKEFELTP